MKIVATDGKKEVPIRINHWWPGRQWAGGPTISHLLVERAEQLGSRYLTVASAHFDDGPILMGTALCCPKDTPSREMGRRIALGRLMVMLKPAGYQLRVENDQAAA